MLYTNLLHLNQSISNVLGDYVKKDILGRETIKEQQIINGQK